MENLFKGVYKNRKVLVTGHTGFKGSWISLWLKELGADLTGFALDPVAGESMFSVCNLNSKMNSVIGDIRNLETIKTVLSKNQPEIVFHLAAQAIVRASYESPVETFDTNVMGTVNLLEACRNTPSVKVVVVITSDKCYENREWIWGYREDDAMGGYDPYSSSKGCAELVTSAYRRSFFHSKNYDTHGLSLSTARAGNVIGGGDWAKDRIIPDSILSLVNKEPIGVRNPGAIRPWQHVLEPNRGYLTLAAKMWEDGSNFADGWNFGPNEGSAVPVRIIAQKVVDCWGSGEWKDLSDKKANRPHEANFLKLNISKVRHLLNWHPIVDLNHTLSMTVDWYKHYYSTPETIVQFTLDQLHNYSETLLEQEKTYE